MSKLEVGKVYRSAVRSNGMLYRVAGYNGGGWWTVYTVGAHPMSFAVRARHLTLA